MISLYTTEKQYAKLADFVKLSVQKGVVLDKEFCQKCLVELRHWGRDADAISAVYKCLRKVNDIGGGGGLQTAATSEVNHSLPQRKIQLCRSVSLDNPAPSPPPPPPPLPRSSSEGDGDLASQTTADTLFCLNSTDFKIRDLSSIHRLIEVRETLCVLLVACTCLYDGCIWCFESNIP